MWSGGAPKPTEEQTRSLGKLLTSEHQADLQLAALDALASAPGRDFAGILESLGRVYTDLSGSGTRYALES